MFARRFDSVIRSDSLTFSHQLALIDVTPFVKNEGITSLLWFRVKGKVQGAAGILSRRTKIYVSDPFFQEDNRPVSIDKRQCIPLSDPCAAHGLIALCHIKEAD